MITLRASLLPGLFGFIGKTRAVPGVTVPDTTIGGFPEFAFTVDTINDPEVEKSLRRMAKRIVASHQSGNRRIIGFEVHGHADQTVRIAKGEARDKAEFEVSRDRAENCRNLLLKFIEEEGGKRIIEGIKINSDATGFGSAHRKFKPATTELQMKQNRRVEIFLKEFIPPDPQPPRPAPPRKPEVRTKFRVQVERGSVTIFGTPTPVSLATGFTALISLDLIFTDLGSRNLTMKYTASSTGKTLPPLGLIPGQGGQLFSRTNFGQGPTLDFDAPPSTTLTTFRGPILLGQDSAIAGVGVGGKFPLEFQGQLSGKSNPDTLSLKGGLVLGNPQIVVGVLPLSGRLEPR
jgi:hypothetical protein